MAEVNYNSNGKILTIFLSGHIDSANSPEIEAQINKAREANPSENIIIDAEKLEYISSAGLRIILRLRKEMPDLKIINVSSDVYEILDMTGFTEMIDVEKAYRVISVDGCEVIGQGANGKVYRLDRDTIVKVYFDPDSLPDIHRERELARKAFVLGIPTAIPYDVVRVGDGYGSVFELLNAKSFIQLIVEEPDMLDTVIKRSVELLKKIHATEVRKGDMPDMKKVVLGWADFLKDHLPADQFNKLHSLVEAVPEDNHMMHGDYHLKNVMLQDGEALLIDMDTLCVGHPVFELASVYNAYAGFSELDHSVSMSFLGIPHETSVEIWEKSIRLYLGTDDEEYIRSVKEKAMLIGYTRIMRRSIRREFDTPQGQKQIECCKAHIADLLGRVDTLVF
ncbi:MAG: anti-sigma factor antagonist [Clostridia bacterium]|nr:anti-sigma factor antagonist [Clostridia bacterium]